MFHSYINSATIAKGRFIIYPPNVCLCGPIDDAAFICITFFTRIIHSHYSVYALSKY